MPPLVHSKGQRHRPYLAFFSLIPDAVVLHCRNGNSGRSLFQLVVAFRTLSDKFPHTLNYARTIPQRHFRSLLELIGHLSEWAVSEEYEK